MDTRPFTSRPIAKATLDSHFGQPAVDAFIPGGVLGPVNIIYSGVYQWYSINLRTNEDFYIGALFSYFFLLYQIRARKHH